MTITPDHILDFWYSERIQKHWFFSTPEIDQEIRDNYETVWEQAASGLLDAWCETPTGSLALAIILDQFPLNMFRDQAKGYSTEQLAVKVARNAIDTQQNKKIEKEKLAFLYMPLMHSEHMEDQDLAVKMFTAAGLDGNIKFAKHHRDIVKRFGRFPHRNAALSRDSTEAELAYLASGKTF